MRRRGQLGYLALPVLAQYPKRLNTALLNFTDHRQNVRGILIGTLFRSRRRMSSGICQFRVA